MNAINIIRFDKNKSNKEIVCLKINSKFKIYQGQLRRGKITNDHQQIRMIRQMFALSNQNYLKQCAKRLKIKPAIFVKAMKKSYFLRSKSVAKRN